VTKTVAIADANSGIGRAAAIELSNRRWRVLPWSKTLLRDCTLQLTARASRS
jgi:NAD(P)-dependent dehydrogenase (short-subunit alcohol dehydrogenase family)